jgi:hypothetical protein
MIMQSTTCHSMHEVIRCRQSTACVTTDQAPIGKAFLRFGTDKRNVIVHRACVGNQCSPQVGYSNRRKLGLATQRGRQCGRSKNAGAFLYRDSRVARNAQRKFRCNGLVALAADHVRVRRACSARFRGCLAILWVFQASCSGLRLRKGTNTTPLRFAGCFCFSTSVDLMHFHRRVLGELSRFFPFGACGLRTACIAFRFRLAGWSDYAIRCSSIIGGSRSPRRFLLAR